MGHVNISHKLSLASHVRACECEGHVILLDLRRGRYLGISGGASQLLAQRLQRWPFSSVHAGAAFTTDSTADLLHKLISHGLVIAAEDASQQDTEADIAARANASESIEEASSTIELGPIVSVPPRSRKRLLQLLNFTRSVASAAFSMRCRSLQSIARSITHRRNRLHSPNAEVIGAMKPAIAAYEALRPFAFTAHAHCMLDSLALVNFLALDGLTPRWVVGVRTGPFAAHSWVQSGHTVLNDQHEFVRQFRPILIV